MNARFRLNSYEHLGVGQVFKDVDSIQPGDDFVEEITTAIGSCAALLAVIGPRWLTVTSADGHRRLDDPADFVRLEIEAAFARNVRVIPVLVEGARIPGIAELPASMAQLARRQALELSPSRFGSDTARLLEILDRQRKAVAEAQRKAREDAQRTVVVGTARKEEAEEERKARDDAERMSDVWAHLEAQQDAERQVAGIKQRARQGPGLPDGAGKRSDAEADVWAHLEAHQATERQVAGIKQRARQGPGLPDGAGPPLPTYHTRSLTENPMVTVPEVRPRL